MTISTSIRFLPMSERPRERCLNQGPGSLSLREILALLIGSGPREGGCLALGASILDRPGPGLPETEQTRAFFTAMETNPETHLVSLPGLGPAKKARLLAAFELGRRYAHFRTLREAEASNLGPERLGADALSKIGPEYRTSPTEWLGFVPVYRGGHTGELCLVERGVRTHVNTDPAELFSRLLALRPQSFLLFHNHPQGTLVPSPADIELTEQVARLSAQLGVPLLAHFIVTATGEQIVPFGGNRRQSLALTRASPNVRAPHERTSQPTTPRNL